MEKHFYSIIIPSYNCKELTAKCLQAIRHNTRGMNYEVVVVDNASTDGVAEFLEGQEDITLILNKVNRNFAGACNQGAEKAKGDILVFLNNDTEVQTDWLREIDRTLSSLDRVGAVGVRLLFPDGKIQHAGVVISPDKLPRPIYSRERADLSGANKEREFQIVTAACIAIPKNVFQKVNGFDEKYKNGMEDVDLCLKIKDLKYKIIYNPKSVVTHHESVAPGRFRYNQNNTDLYMGRWKAAISDEHKYYKEDNKNSFWILVQDLRNMSFGPDRYGTRPLYISFLRVIYIPLHQICAILSYLLKGNISGLLVKIKERLNVKS